MKCSCRNFWAREMRRFTVASEQSVKPRPERTVEGRYDPEYDAKFLAWQLDYTSRVQARVAPTW